MKFLLLVTVLFGCACARSQGIRDKEWIKIRATRKDGSRIIDRSGPDTSWTGYFFIRDSVYLGVDHQYPLKEKYLIQNNILSIEPTLKYQIDSVTDVHLYLSQMSKNKFPNDKLNRYVFMNADYLFDSLVRHRRLIILGDSEIVCTNLFCPTFNGEIYSLFKQLLPVVNRSLSVKGYLVVTSTGAVQRVVLDAIHTSPRKDTADVIQALYESTGYWIAPPTPKPFVFRIPFYINLLPYGQFPLIRFVFFGEEQFQTSPKQRFTLADKHFSNGMRFFNKQKFKDAIYEFKMCIAVDPDNVDAYYNLGYAYQKSGNQDLACKVWKQLSEMGQKGGEEIYKMQCR